MYVLWLIVQAIELVGKAACTLVVFGNNRHVEQFVHQYSGIENKNLF